MHCITLCFALLDFDYSKNYIYIYTSYLLTSTLLRSGVHHSWHLSPWTIKCLSNLRTPNTFNYTSTSDLVDFLSLIINIQIKSIKATNYVDVIFSVLYLLLKKNKIYRHTPILSLLCLKQPKFQIRFCFLNI